MNAYKQVYEETLFNLTLKIEDKNLKALVLHGYNKAINSKYDKVPNFLVRFCSLYKKCVFIQKSQNNIIFGSKWVPNENLYHKDEYKNGDKC